MKIKVLTGYLDISRLLSNLACTENTGEYTHITDKLYILNDKTFGIVDNHSYVVHYYHSLRLDDLINTKVEEIEVKPLFLLAFK